MFNPKPEVAPEAEEGGANGAEHVPKLSNLVPPDGSGGTQTLAEFLNRTKMTPLVKVCHMDREDRVSQIKFLYSKRKDWHT